MSTINCLNEEGCLGPANNFFSQSKVGVTASLVIEAVALIIGILAITHVLPAAGTIPGAVIAGLGGFFLVLTIALVCSRYAGTSDARNPGQPVSTPQPTNNTSNVGWKEKLEQIRAQNQAAVSPPPEVSPEDCLNTLSFLAQAGSPKLFKGSIPYVEPVSEKMKTLKNQCLDSEGEKLYLSIANAFLENLPVLNTFIHSQTQAILLQEPTKAERTHFKLMNKQIRMILLFLMSYEFTKLEYLKKYRQHVTHAFGNREWHNTNFQQPCYYFNRLKTLKKEKSEELHNFLFLFSVYRRHALLHLFPTKIEERSNCHDVELRTLLSATWFHGTRAVISLSDTDFILMPTGWLHQIGHTSFFGEMSDGCQSNGVNANSLSGTYLDHVDWSVNLYATGFQFDIKKEIQTVEWFLGIEVETNNDYFYKNFGEYSVSLPRLEAALKRWARWDQTAFSEKMPLLLAKLKYLKEIIVITEDKKKKFIMQDYELSEYESFCHSVEQIGAFLEASLPLALTNEQKEKIEENFPAVLGSLTLLSEPRSYDDESGEHLVRDAAQLGKDLQLLCVEKGDLGKVEKWVQAYLPNSPIKIFSFEQLEKAQEINKIVSPYLADIFSLSKFEKLCTFMY